MSPTKIAKSYASCHEGLPDKVADTAMNRFKLPKTRNGDHQSQPVEEIPVHAFYTGRFQVMDKKGFFPAARLGDLDDVFRLADKLKMVFVQCAIVNPVEKENSKPNQSIYVNEKFIDGWKEKIVASKIHEDMREDTTG
jgi:hypothetical protein